MFQKDQKDFFPPNNVLTLLRTGAKALPFSKLKIFVENITEINCVNILRQTN